MPTPSFRNHLARLAYQQYRQGDAATSPGLGSRVWNVPYNYPTGTDIQNPIGLRTACSRADLNTACLYAYQNGTVANSSTGRIGSVMAYKKAIDYMGAHERALQARFASPVRCRIWASARRTGHGDATYGVFGSVQREIELALAAATAAPNTPP